MSSLFVHCKVCWKNEVGEYCKNEDLYTMITVYEEDLYTTITVYEATWELHLIQLYEPMLLLQKNLVYVEN